jgi:hypothetical protein
MVSDQGKVIALIKCPRFSFREMGLAAILEGFIEYKSSPNMDWRRHLLNISQYASQSIERVK